jgi:hypothetical protein
MARNKITFEKDYDEACRAIYRFSGTQRQPTLDEIEEFIVDNNLQYEIDDYFMVCAIKGSAAESGYQGWNDNEKNKVVEFWGYNGGSGDGCCPICGHERDMSGSRCPVCDKPWEES